MNANDKKTREEFMPYVRHMRMWLGQNGIEFFRKIKAEHGKVNAVWNEGGIPHSVHFREGMQVRNQLRDLTKNGWSQFEYDNTWADVIEECIKEDAEKPEPKVGWLKRVVGGLRDWWAN